MKPLIRRRRDGRYDIRLPRPERQLLGSLAEQLAGQLGEEPNPASPLGRLFPPAYGEVADGDRETEYRLLAHGELAESHRQALARLAAIADTDSVAAADLGAWMRAANSLRLVLGSNLNVSEEGDERPDDPDHPDSARFAVYDFLSWFTDHLVEALAETLVDPPEDVSG
ncbi:MAG: DUF2017 family protein [Acidimicrobiales bacterium]